MQCPNTTCNTEVAENEPFCPACGTEIVNKPISAAVPATPLPPSESDPVTAAEVDESQLPVLAYIYYGDQEIPIRDGGKPIRIARAEANTTGTTLGLEDPTASGTLVDVYGKGGKMFVFDNGASSDTLVGKPIAKGMEVEIETNNVVIVGSTTLLIG